MRASSSQGWLELLERGFERAGLSGMLSCQGWSLKVREWFGHRGNEASVSLTLFVHRRREVRHMGTRSSGEPQSLTKGLLHQVQLQQGTLGELRLIFICKA